MSIFEILTLRSEFEDIVMNFKIPGDRKPGTIDNLVWFKETAYQKNSRKKGFKRAVQICSEITGSEECQKRKKNTKHG